jgi:hypothetical protein
VDNPHGLPFVGGYFLYLGYDLLSQFEAKVDEALPDSFPLAAMARVPAALLINRREQTAWLVAETAEQLQHLQQLAHGIPPFNPHPVSLQSLQEDPPQWYTDAVLRLKQYIYEGDVFQVNISRGWRAELGRKWPPRPVCRPAPCQPGAVFRAGRFWQRADCQLLARAPGAGARWLGRHPADCRHPSALAGPDRRCRPQAAADFQHQGARRARDADRSGTQ